MRYNIHTLFSTILLIGCAILFGCAPKPSSMLIKDVKLFDGLQVARKVDVLIVDGIITQIMDRNLVTSAAVVIDGSGKTIIPPLVNSHVHVHQPAQLKESQAHGIGAMLDLYSTSETARQLLMYKDSLSYADYYTSGPGATAPSGHGTQFGLDVPTVSSTASARVFVKDRIAEGAAYIKVIRDPLLPTLDFETTSIITEEAHENGLSVIGHISRLDDALQLSTDRVNGLAHIWIDRTINEEELEQLSHNRTFVIPTLLVTQKLLQYGQSKGWSNHYLSFREVQHEVRKLHSGGVLILEGTDAPNLSINHHTDLIEELKLLKAAGLSDLDALKTATVNPAIAFSFLEKQVIKEGNQANFLLIAGDPTTKIGALSDIEGIWKNGIRIK